MMSLERQTKIQTLDSYIIIAGLLDINLVSQTSVLVVTGGVNNELSLIVVGQMVRTYIWRSVR